MKKIAVLTSVRNDVLFTDRWIAYYGAALGPENLYIQLDGLDQPVPDPATGVNAIPLPFVKRNVVAGEKARAKRASDLAAQLFADGYDLVIGTDIDEFLVVDPNTNKSLHQYLSDVPVRGCLSGLGLDVVQDTNTEPALDRGKGFLAQRSVAILSPRYTKNAILSEPLQWGSGYHRVKRRNFKIDPNLYMFHFGSVDRSVSDERLNDQDRIDQGWTEHQIRREKMFDQMLEITPVAGDDRFSSARSEMSWRRPFYAWNKPGHLKRNFVVQIPDRFKTIV
ncbi:MAG: glycosyltransferase family 2 protein [Pseudomonadota bacterium]